MLKIYVDMDEVLTEFLQYVLVDRLGDTEAYKKYQNGERNEYAIEKVLGVSCAEFWDTVNGWGEEFWVNMPPAELAGTLWETLYDNRLGGQLIVATSPTQEPDCVSGKLKWLHKVFGSSFRDYIFITDKSLLAKPDTVLIDDMPKNIVPFRKNGGVGITYPCYCNTFARRPAQKDIDEIVAIIGEVARGRTICETTVNIDSELLLK